MARVGPSAGRRMKMPRPGRAAQLMFGGVAVVIVALLVAFMTFRSAQSAPK